MLNKTTLIAAALLGSVVAAPAMAQTASTGASSFDGFYGGAELGYGKAKTSLDLTPSKGAIVSGKASKSDVDYGVYLGYGAVVGDNIYLGAEANLGTGGGKATTSLANNTVKVNPGLHYGVAALAGVVIGDNNLLYGKVGFERQKMKVSLQDAQDKVTEHGLVFGAGYERMVTSNISLRGEVLRVNYKHKDADFSTGNLKLDSKETRFSLGATMRF